MSNYNIKDKILDAVISCIRKDFYEELQMTQVAAMIGVSVRTVNRYYPNKEKLICIASFRFQSNYYNSRIYEFENLKEKGKLQRELLIDFLRYLKFSYQNNKDETVFLGRTALYCMQYGYCKEFDMESVKYNLKNYITNIINKGKHEGSIKNTIDTDKTVFLIASTFGGIVERLTILCRNFEIDQLMSTFTLFDDYFELLNDWLMP